MTNIEVMAWLVVVVNSITLYLTLKKIWWVPILGLIQEIPWAILFWMGEGTYPLLVLVVVYSILYIMNIKKWYKERDVKRKQQTT